MAEGSSDLIFSRLSLTAIRVPGRLRVVAEDLKVIFLNPFFQYIPGD